MTCEFTGSMSRCRMFYWESTDIQTGTWLGPEDNVVKVNLNDTFQEPKFAEITIADFDHTRQFGVDPTYIPRYSAYQRIKLEDIESGKVIFFGRIEFINVQNKDGGSYIILQCKDFLNELQNNIVEHDFSGAATVGKLIKDIIDYHTYTELSYSSVSPAGNSFEIMEHENAGCWICVDPTVAKPEMRCIEFITDGYTPITYNTVNANIYYAQQFTPTDNYQITTVDGVPSYVKLRVSRYGWLGNITVQIKETDSNGRPAGAVLASGTFNVDALPIQLRMQSDQIPQPAAWVKVDLSGSATLTMGKRYAILVEPTACPAGFYLAWWYADSDYPSRTVVSTDAGVTWTGTSGMVSMFQIFGYIVNGARARIIYDDTVKKRLVVTDVCQAEEFTTNRKIYEWYDEQCTIPVKDELLSGNQVYGTLNWALWHNINTNSIDPDLGGIDACQTRNFYFSSQTPLEAIQAICLDAADGTKYDFFLKEHLSAGLWPPFILFSERETLPADPVPTNGLTIKYGGVIDDQERPMMVNFSFSEPCKEVTTEAHVASWNKDRVEISSVAKAGALAYAIKIFLKRHYQAMQHVTQEGIDANADNVVSLIDHPLMRGAISTPYFPVYKVGVNYKVLRAGERIRVVNDDIAFLNTGTPGEGKDMLVVKIRYEEPNVTCKLDLKELSYGFGTAEYDYPKATDDTYMPKSVDSRINSGGSGSSGGGNGGGTLFNVQYGYVSDLRFTPDPASPTDTVIWNGDSIYFYNGDKQLIDSGSYKIPDLLEPEEAFYLTYIYFDLDCDTPEVLKIISDNLGDTGGYKSVITSKTGLLAIVSRAYQNPDFDPISSPMGNPYFPQINVFPINGTDPYIGVNRSWIDMEGLTTWDYNTAGYRYCHRYLMAINETQVWPNDGMLRLTYESYKVGRWYDEMGVVIHSDFGIGIYAWDDPEHAANLKDMSFTTFRDLSKYDGWMYNMDYQMRIGSPPNWNEPRKWCSTWVNDIGEFCFRYHTRWYATPVSIPAPNNIMIGEIWADDTEFLIVNGLNTVTSEWSHIIIQVGDAGLEKSTLNIVGTFGSDLIPSKFGGTPPCTLYKLGDSTHCWNELWVCTINSGDIFPLETCTYDLGSSDKEWAELYLNETLVMDGAVVKGHLIPEGSCIYDLGWADENGCSEIQYYNYDDGACKSLDINGDGHINILDYILAKLRHLDLAVPNWDDEQFEQYSFSFFFYIFGGHVNGLKALRWRNLYVQDISAYSINPAESCTYNLGQASPFLAWKNIYLNGEFLSYEGTTFTGEIYSNSGTFYILGGSGKDVKINSAGTGGIYLQPLGTGHVYSRTFFPETTNTYNLGRDCDYKWDYLFVNHIGTNACKVTNAYITHVYGTADYADCAYHVDILSPGAAGNHYLTMVDATSGCQDVQADADLYYNPSTNYLYVSNLYATTYWNLPSIACATSIDISDTSTTSKMYVVLASSDGTCMTLYKNDICYLESGALYPGGGGGGYVHPDPFTIGTISVTSMIHTDLIGNYTWGGNVEIDGADQVKIYAQGSYDPGDPFAGSIYLSSLNARVTVHAPWGFDCVNCDSLILPTHGDTGSVIDPREGSIFFSTVHDRIFLYRAGSWVAI